MQTKESLRLLIRQKLQAQSPEERSKRSLIIEERLFGLEAFRKAAWVCFYASLPSEVDTTAMIDRSLEAGKHVIVPRVSIGPQGRTQLLDLYEIKNRRQDLAKGPMGIMEPLPSTARLADIKKVECVIVPGIVFDKENHRIGYGKGFYDRFLAQLGSEALKIGLAFSFQMVEEIPKAGHDVRLDIILTD